MPQLELEMEMSIQTVDSKDLDVNPPARRSDDDLTHTALKSLSNNAHLNQVIRRLDISVHDGTLVLSGRVSSFYLKQILQMAAGKIDGVNSIDDQVEVRWPDKQSNAWHA